MRRAFLAAGIAAACTGCQNSIAVQSEAEIVSSMIYDEVPCDELAARRNALAARHGLAPQAKREPRTESAVTGFGIFIPDTRSQATREQARALGEITAMNRSMERRRCQPADDRSAERR